jgi:hypothetical protein
MTGMPFIKFFPSDHQADALLKLCSFAAQGVWVLLLCIAAQSTRFGYVLLAGRKPSIEDLTRVIGGTPDELKSLVDELERNGVFSRDRQGTIYCRRMIREEKKRAASAKGGKLGGRATHERQKGIFSTQPPTQGGTQEPTQLPYSRSHILETRIQKPDSLFNGFEEFWKTYPRKVGQKEAEEAYEQALSKTTPDIILAGAKAYATTRRGQDSQYTLGAVRWLREARWRDEVPTSAAPPASPMTTCDRETAIWTNRVRGFRATGIWPIDVGPKPGERGCDAPIKILAEFGFVQPARVPA